MQSIIISVLLMKKIRLRKLSALFRIMPWGWAALRDLIQAVLLPGTQSPPPPCNGTAPVSSCPIKLITHDGFEILRSKCICSLMLVPDSALNPLECPGPKNVFMC